LGVFELTITIIVLDAQHKISGTVRNGFDGHTRVRFDWTIGK
jgi:hypothetical protein